MVKADIKHWRIEGQSGDDGGSFLRMIRPSTWPHPNKPLRTHAVNTTPVYILKAPVNITVAISDTLPYDFE